MLNAADVQSALHVPPAALVDRRIPKRLLSERCPTSADRKLVQENIEQVCWSAVLKPSNVGIAPLVDDAREYLEVSILNLELRDIDLASSRARRLAELTHRAIPYPIMLLISVGAELAISLSHLRRAQDGTASSVLEGPMYWVELNSHLDHEDAKARGQALAALEVGRKPWPTLWHLYQGWIEVAIAWQAVPISHAFTLPASVIDAETMRQLVQRIVESQQEMDSLRRAALRERQIPRLAELNQTIQRLGREVDEAKDQLARINPSRL